MAFTDKDIVVDKDKKYACIITQSKEYMYGFIIRMLNVCDIFDFSSWISLRYNSADGFYTSPDYISKPVKCDNDVVIEIFVNTKDDVHYLSECEMSCVKIAKRRGGFVNITDIIINVD